jgi:hypothetical protein
MNNDQSPQPQKQSIWSKLFGGSKKQDTDTPVASTPMPDPTTELPPTDASPSMENDFSIPAPEEVVTPTASPADTVQSTAVPPTSPDINVNVSVEQPPSSPQASSTDIPQPPVDPMVSPAPSPSVESSFTPSQSAGTNDTVSTEDDKNTPPNLTAV